MKKFFFFIIILFSSVIGKSQQSVNVYGTVNDQTSNAPLMYATVRVKDASAKLIIATITDEKGEFKLAFTPMDNATIEFSLIGYETLVKTISKSNLSINLGSITLKPDAALLKEVSIIGEQPSVSLKLDKKIFLVGKDVLSQTGSSLDVLNGVPSVSVSPTGSVSLRGNSNVLILIDGRRSGFTQGNALDQLPADQIERVEVITNPSSRYDAAGSAGIINIVLKKNKKSGLNGQLSLVAGIPNETKITPSLNYKSSKINLFSTFGLRYSDYDGLYISNQSTNDLGTINLLHKRQDEDRHDDAKMAYFGGDFILNNHNTITAAFLNKTTNDHDKTSLQYDYTKKGQILDSTLIRTGESWEKRNYNQLEFNYTKTFNVPHKKYTIDIQYDFWNSDKDWNLFTQKTVPIVTNFSGIRTSSLGASKDFMLQTDYVHPLDSVSNLEFGIKAEKRSVTSAFIAEQQNNNEWQILDGINNQLVYNELIGSAYAQFSNKWNKITYQLGLRTELTKIELEDKAGAFNSSKNYMRFFPTLNLTYPFSESASLQASYSKRINRPSLFSLYPFNELTDFNAQYVGNPNLAPSYADVFELGFLKNWGKLTFNPSLYYQNNKNILQDYTYRNPNGIFITTPINIDGETRGGFELSTLYNPYQFLQFSIEMNAYYFNQKGFYVNQDFNYKGRILTSRISAQLKLPKKLSLQGRYNFTSAQSNAQSRTASIHNLDFGAGKIFLKDKATLLFDVTNLFNLKKFETTTTGSNYSLSQVNSPNAARYRLTFVYKLNLKENQGVRQAKTGNRN
ncbi:TonB-dependent receptor domain-containing protein [Pedobacter boryungensis]|uniref:TonB-dependent receptor n=1 Tax=Pedobacter boryungensis TaxID=869962 RepID=A0ABX2DCM6_9SPHI|nr:TonB-dependent receptor [Pedobacter boryungensis]NQX31843.1 TonB-dependent receptor [Pedobacter boryungensis]